MPKEKRYMVTVCKNIYARNDNEAKVKAAKFAEEIDGQTIELVENYFASLTTRLVHKGTLTLYDNKIIEL